MPVDPLSIFLLVFIVGIVNQAMNSIRRHREEAQQRAVDKKVAEALQENSAAIAQTRRADVNEPRAAADATSAQVNNDPCVVIPFRGGSAADAGNVPKPEPEPVVYLAADADEEPLKREPVVVEDELGTTEAIFARDNSYAEYEEPTVYRRNPGWMATERRSAVTVSLEEPVESEAEVAVLQERWADYAAMMRDGDGGRELDSTVQ